MFLIFGRLLLKMDFMYFVYFMCVEIMCTQGNMGEKPVAECFTRYKYIGNKMGHMNRIRQTIFLWNLSHWGRVTYICISELSIIGSDNGLSSGRRQAIIWPNAGILLNGPLGTNSEILIEIHTFSFKKMHLKMSSGKWRPFVSASMC